MKLFFPVVFLMFVAYAFVAPKYQAAQNYVSQIVASAVAK